MSGVAGDAIGGSNILFFLAPYSVCLVWRVMLLVAPTFYFLAPYYVCLVWRVMLLVAPTFYFFSSLLFVSGVAGDAIGGSNIPCFFSSLLCVSGVAGDAIGGSNILFF